MIGKILCAMLLAFVLVQSAPLKRKIQSAPLKRKIQPLPSSDDSELPSSFEESSIDSGPPKKRKGPLPLNDDSQSPLSGEGSSFDASMEEEICATIYHMMATEIPEKIGNYTKLDAALKTNESMEEVLSFINRSRHFIHSELEFFRESAKLKILPDVLMEAEAIDEQMVNAGLNDNGEWQNWIIEYFFEDDYSDESFMSDESSLEEVTKKPVAAKSSTKKVTKKPVAAKSSDKKVTKKPVAAKSSAKKVTKKPVAAKSSLEKGTKKPVAAKSSLEKGTKKPVAAKSSLEKGTEKPKKKPPTVKPSKPSKNSSEQSNVPLA